MKSKKAKATIKKEDPKGKKIETSDTKKNDFGGIPNLDPKNFLGCS